MPDMTHKATPNDDCDQITPESLAGTATVPDSIKKLMANANNNNSEMTKIVSGGGRKGG